MATWIQLVLVAVIGFLLGISLSFLRGPWR